MDPRAWQQLDPWLELRPRLPVGSLRLASGDQFLAGSAERPSWTELGGHRAARITDPRQRNDTPAQDEKGRDCVRHAERMHRRRRARPAPRADDRHPHRNPARRAARGSRAGFEPRVTAFPKPPVHATLARLLGAREIGLIPASFAFHLAQAQPGIVAREIVDTQVLAEWSILLSAHAQSAAIARFLDSARRCAAEKDWVPPPAATAAAETDSLPPGLLRRGLARPLPPLRQRSFLRPRPAPSRRLRGRRRRNRSRAASQMRRRVDAAS